MTSVFFALPDHLKVSILDAWLAFPFCGSQGSRHLHKILEAVETNAVYRKDLSELLRSPGCVFHNHVDDCYGRTLKVLFEYGIKVRDMSLYRVQVEDASFRSVVLRHLAPSIRNLTFNIFSKADCTNRYTLIDEGFDFDVSNAMLAEIFDAFPLLEHFNVERIVSSMLPIKLSSSFCKLFTKCPHLRSLTLNCCFDISGDIVNALCAAPCLDRISITNSSTFASDVFDRHYDTRNSHVRHIDTHCLAFCLLFPRIKIVALRCVCSADIVTLARGCPLITSANISLMDTVQPPEAAQFCEYWQCMRDLNMTTFRYTTSAFASDAAVIVVTQMRSLHTFGYFDSTTAIHAPVCNYPPLYHGSQLRVLQCDCCTAEMLQTVVQGCPYLHTLHLDGGLDVNADFTVLLLDSLHLLTSSSVKYLRLSHYRGVSNAHISTLTTLESLTLDHVYSETLTNDGAINLARNSTTLRALHLNRVPDITVSVGLAVVRACPTLSSFTCTISDDISYNNYKELVEMVQQLVRQAYPHVKTFAIRQD